MSSSIYLAFIGYTLNLIQPKLVKSLGAISAGVPLLEIKAEYKRKILGTTLGRNPTQIVIPLGYLVHPPVECQDQGSSPEVPVPDATT